MEQEVDTEKLLYCDNLNEEVIKECFEKVNPEMKRKYKIKRVKFALSENQRDELLDHALYNNPNHYLIIRLQLETGLRIGEIVNMIIEQINFEEKTITIEYHIDKNIKEWGPKTMSGNRTVPVDDDLIKELKKMVLKRTKGYVFLSNKKSKFLETSAIAFIDKYAKECKSIGKNIGSHSLRRTYASVLLNQKVDIANISKRLGHSDIKTTMIYLYDITDLRELQVVRDAIKGMNTPREELEKRHRKINKENMG